MDKIKNLRLGKKEKKTDAKSSIEEFIYDPKVDGESAKDLLKLLLAEEMKEREKIQQKKKLDKENKSAKTKANKTVQDIE